MKQWRINYDSEDEAFKLALREASFIKVAVDIFYDKKISTFFSAPPERLYKVRAGKKNNYKDHQGFYFNSMGQKISDVSAKFEDWAGSHKKPAIVIGVGDDFALEVDEEYAKNFLEVEELEDGEDE